MTLPTPIFVTNGVLLCFESMVNVGRLRWSAMVTDPDSSQTEYRLEACPRSEFLLCLDYGSDLSKWMMPVWA